MLFGWLKPLLGIFASLAAFFRDRQLIEAGKAEKTVEEIKEVEARVEKAKSVARAVDPERTERLRRRFDRGREGGE
jgi:hypothetical protein